MAYQRGKNARLISYHRLQKNPWNLEKIKSYMDPLVILMISRSSMQTDLIPETHWTLIPFAEVPTAAINFRKQLPRIKYIAHIHLLLFC